MSFPIQPLRRRLLGGLALATLSLGGLSACGPSGSASSAESGHQPSFNGVDITGASYARTLSLPDVSGQKRSLSEFKGKVVFVFFGFTQCPDVCPTTMAELAEVRRQLGPQADKLQALFVTVDPDRDTADVLKGYLNGLDASFVGLRGTQGEVDEAAREFKVFYQKVPTQNGNYTIDHTAGGFLFDTEGRVRVFERYGMGAAKLLADVQQLLPR